MADTRHRYVRWNVGVTPSMEGAQLAVLMDIREELHSLNNIFRCYKFLQIPGKIEAIRKNTAKPKRKKNL